MGIPDHGVDGRTEIFVGGEELGAQDGDPPCTCSPLQAGDDGVVVAAAGSVGMTILDADGEVGDG